MDGNYDISKKSCKLYSCKSSSKSNTSFNRKLTRSSFKQNDGAKHNNRYNTFYNNHYTIGRDDYNSPLTQSKADSILMNKFNNKLNPKGINNSIFSSGSSTMIKPKYCVNCGNYGHTRGTCVDYDISLGVVALRLNTNTSNYEYLIVMRKHSHGYCDLIRGKYDLNDEAHIKRLLEETTLEERNYLLTRDFLENWIYLWGKNNHILRRITNTSKLDDKFNTLKQNYDLKSVILTLSSCWSEPEWGFPKGQRDGLEKNIDTAFREFCEETGYKKRQTVCVLNLIPQQEIFIGSNNKHYRQLYYMCLMDYNDTQGDISFQENEIGDAKWVSFDELKTKFRYYDVEKLKVADNINNVLNNYGFVEL